MRLFRDDNTEGYLAEELDALNEMWEARIEELRLEEGTDEYYQEMKWFCDTTV